MIDSEYMNALESIEHDISFSLIAARDILIDIEKGKRILSLISQRVKEDTTLLISSSIARRATRVSAFLDGEIKKKAENAESEIYERSSLSNWEEKDLEALVTSFFPSAQIEYMSLQETRHLDGAVALSWWEKTYSRYLDADEKDSFISALRERDVPFSSKVAIIKLIPEKMKAKVNDEAEKNWHEVQMKTQ